MRTSHVILIVALAAGLGLLAFGYTAKRAVKVEHADMPQALLRFATVRDSLGLAEPMLKVDGSGELVRAPEPEDATEQPRLSRLNVLVYRSSQQRLVQVDVPFWFFRMKGPAVQFTLRDSEFDMKQLGVTPADLQKHGPGLVLDEDRANGDRLLVWTE